MITFIELEDCMIPKWDEGTNVSNLVRIGDESFIRSEQIEDSKSSHVLFYLINLSPGWKFEEVLQGWIRT